MATTPAAPLARFRAELSQSVLGLRRDALYELLDAVLSGDGASSLVRHSLAPCFRRGWASICDALADGTLDGAALRRLFAQTMPPALVEARLLWVVDGTTWPRPEAKTSPERTWGRFVTAGTPQSGIIGAWEYQWLAAIPEATGSWVLPLAVGRRGPQAGTATTLAIAQLRAAQAARPADAPRPLLLLDSHYDVAELVQADLGVDILARLASNRRFFRPPGPYSGRGPRPKHGPVFRCADATTHGTPDRTQGESDPTYGTVTIDVWERLHTQPAPTIELRVIRVTLGRLPRREQPPKPLWLVWYGGALPTDLRTLQRWYQRRFAVEHAFRFLKQSLGWTSHSAPFAADGRSLELAAGGRAVASVAGPRVGGRPVPALGTPAAGERAQSRTGPPRLCRTLGRLGTPARPPRARGKSPGRRPGQCPGPAPRCPVQRRGPPWAA